MAELSWRSVMGSEGGDGGESSSAAIVINPKPIRELSETLAKKNDSGSFHCYY